MTGREAIDGAVPDHLDNEAGILTSLTPTELDQLEDLLRKVQQGLAPRRG